MNVPKLRFKEFTGEWEEKSLGEVTKVISLKNKGAAQLPIYSINNRIGFVPQGEQFENMDGISRGYDTSLYKVVIPNMFAYNPARINVGSIGYSANLSDIIISSLYVCFVLNGYNDDMFFWQWFKSKKFNVLVNRFTEGGVRQYLFYENLARIKTFVSSCNEQEKIAMFLNMVDSKIENQQAIVKSLENQKKALMQKIFSQELRFKDDAGKEFPAWEEKKLGEVGNIITGKTPDTSNEKYWGGSILFVTPADMDGNKYLKMSERSVTSEIRYNILEIGTVMVTCIGATIGKMAITTCEAVTNQQINSFYSATENNEFIYYALLNIVPQIRNLKSSSTMPILNKSEFSELRIGLPCVNEQNKIVDALSLVDEKIENEKNVLEHWQQIKKGLLQQMFV